MKSYNVAEYYRNNKSLLEKYGDLIFILSIVLLIILSFCAIINIIKFLTKCKHNYSVIDVEYTTSKTGGTVVIEKLKCRKCNDKKYNVRWL